MIPYVVFLFHSPVHRPSPAKSLILIMQTLTTLRGPKPLTYDVFISCSDELRSGFPGHLANSLDKRGFSTCINHGESIQNCRIFIVILCENYASRLDELVKITDEYAKGKDRWIFSVFYYVTPSEVRHQDGRCKSFLIPDCERFQKYVSVLGQVTDVCGWHLDIAKSISESDYIEEIIQGVSNHVACSVGLDRRVEKVMDCLNSGSNDSNNNGVSVVGICGGPGLGKTTLARRVYRFGGGIEFDYCRLSDKVSEYGIKHGLVLLKQILLYEIIGHPNSTMFERVDEEMLLTIKHMLNQKKVFLIFEDIHDPQVLEVIVELTMFFGSGSRVIITTQNKSLLENHGIERIYEVEKLDNNEALQFLCLKVFNSVNFDLSYFSILKRVVTYAAGHPFILEVIGSHLGGKGVEECKKALDQYEMIQNHEIQKILQVSYNALGEFHQKMLIHIVIHHKEWELSLVEATLDKIYGDCSKKDIRVLIDKGFLKINELCRVTLHCSTLDMVRYNASLQHPCKRSRLPTNILEENMEYSCKFSRLSKDTLEE